MRGEIEIVGFEDRFAADFASLNYDWIAKSYNIEAHDREQLDNPVESVIEPGGQIFFAISDDKAVGTAAMIRVDSSSFELAKMAVSPEYRNRGIGDKLIISCVGFASEKRASEIILESNTKQAAAIELYRKHGFIETELDPNSQFARANIRMILAIESPKL